MNVNSAHMGVQALGALMSLGGDEDIRNTIVAAGGYPLILEAMRQHASKVLQMRACGALWALAASLSAVEQARGTREQTRSRRSPT